MSFELNILVLQQEIAEQIPFESPLKLQIESNEILPHAMFWPFMSSNKGTWYIVGVEEDDFFSASPVLDSEFESVEDKDLPYWVNDEDAKSNLTSLKISDTYREELFKLMRCLLKQSPIRSIMFMSRYQGGDKEVICGVLSLDEFIDLQEQGKVLFNVSYIIRHVE
ncbi:hypothetical protein O9H85_21410 [Paenibacillus filicis]|uniref:DUF4279 domain-containing protein n=1 Tax=Paenibacillus gyeongsangnamensis TaxID=3388067 RepID=A0ABT4QDN2_9BACL|nr:hypothetical protein [Paenibacillus filicis]MCZ8514933.1 hypothetical protein [Paenibacillus filicis]